MQIEKETEKKKQIEKETEKDKQTEKERRETYRERERTNIQRGKGS